MLIHSVSHLRKIELEDLHIIILLSPAVRIEDLDLLHIDLPFLLVESGNVVSLLVALLLDLLLEANPLLRQLGDVAVLFLLVESLVSLVHFVEKLGRLPLLYI